MNLHPSRQEVTQVLHAWNQGDRDAPERLMPLVYEELRHLARRSLQRERSDHTLQATSLVHEAYLRLVDQNSMTWQNRAQFFAVAAQIMRRILVDHARSQQTAKRGGLREKLEFDEALAPSGERAVDLIALDDALQLFEEGVERLRAATGLLATAEAQVKLLVEQADGLLSLEPFRG